MCLTYNSVEVTPCFDIVTLLQYAAKTITDMFQYEYQQEMAPYKCTSVQWVYVNIILVPEKVSCNAKVY